MKTCVIDVGGGLRGIYAVGVFDYLMENQITFDQGIGISAGSANLASFVANQKGRNYVFYTEYAFRKKYMSVANFVFHKSYINLDYVYSTLSNSKGEYPLDYYALMDNPMKLMVVATNALTGEAKYFTKDDIGLDNYDIFKASSCIPAVCQPYVINGVPYFDGALSDPVPVQKALDMGFDKIVLILTKPLDKPREVGNDDKLADRIEDKYPLAAANFRKRAEKYNAGVELAKKLVSEGKAIIIAPDDTCGVTTLSKNKDNLIKLYDKGYNDASKIQDFLK